MQNGGQAVQRRAVSVPPIVPILASHATYYDISLARRITLIARKRQRPQHDGGSFLAFLEPYGALPGAHRGRAELFRKAVKKDVEEAEIAEAKAKAVSATLAQQHKLIVETKNDITAHYEVSVRV